MLLQAFDAWSCYTFIDSEWLKEDVSIQCGTDEHWRVKAVAIVAIIFYPVGLLILNASLLFSARHAIVKGRPTVLSQSIAFLYREYEVRRPHTCVTKLSCACLLALRHHPLCSHPFSSLLSHRE